MAGKRVSALAVAVMAASIYGSFAMAQAPETIVRHRPTPQRFTPAQVAAGTTGLPTWTGQITTAKGKIYPYTMVGTDPAAGSQTTIVPVYIVPLILKYSDGTVFDPTTRMAQDTRSTVDAMIASPIFQSTSFSAGKVHVGTTQYIDAFQRANFWSSVQAQGGGYHVLLGAPTVLPPQTYNVPKTDGSTFAGPVAPYLRATLSYNFIEKNITGQVFAQFPQITPNALTLFVTYNVFPANAYGYHDVYGSSTASGLTYAYVSYLQPYTQMIDADISTLAHEVGEWMDDPYVSNTSPCGILEVGDPLNYNVFELPANGFTWHPQDLAMIGYFGEVPVPSVNGWLTFRNAYTLACSNGA